MSASLLLVIPWSVALVGVMMVFLVLVAGSLPFTRLIERCMFTTLLTLATMPLVFSIVVAFVTRCFVVVVSVGGPLVVRSALVILATLGAWIPGSGSVAIMLAI